MSIYKSYKHGKFIKTLTAEYGVRKTFNALKRSLTSNVVRIKHNRIQMLNTKTNVWSYKS